MEFLTPGEIITTLLAVASAIVLLGNAWDKITKAWRSAKAPNEEQNARLDKLEAWRKVVDRKLDNDHDSNMVTHRALLALLDHGIDGNNIEQMQHAKEELQEHLIKR